MHERAQELACQGYAACEAGDFAAGLRLHQEALAAVREYPPFDEAMERYLWLSIGHAAQRCGELEIARKNYERLVRTLRRDADPHSLQLADVLHRLGDTHIQRGEPGIARVYLTESANIFVALREYDYAAHVFDDLADFAVASEDWEEAQQCFHDCLEMARRDANAYRQIRALCGLAVLAAKQNVSDSSEGYFADAQRLFAESETLITGECYLRILIA